MNLGFLKKPYIDVKTGLKQRMTKENRNIDNGVTTP